MRHGFFERFVDLSLQVRYFHFTSASSLSDNGSWSLIELLGATFAWVLLGGRGVKPKHKSPLLSRLAQYQIKQDKTEEGTSDADIPPPVTAEDNLDGVSYERENWRKFRLLISKM